MDLKKIEMLEDLRSGRTTVLEPEEKTVEEAFLSKKSEHLKSQETQIEDIKPFSHIESKREQSTRVLFPSRNNVEKVAKKPEIAEIEEEIEETEDIEEEIETVSKPEKQLDTILENESFINSEEEDDKKSEVQNKTRKIKFRIKVFTIVVCCVVTLFSGLAIHNAVKIKHLNQQIEQATTQYNVNLEKYIYRLSKIDGLKNEDDVLDNTIDSSKITNDRILESASAPIQNPQDIPQKTNWFNKLVDRLSRIFRS